jgi:hypothetical protein
MRGWGAAGLLGTLMPLEAWACAVCIASGDAGPNWGYYWSWLLLTALPFVLVGAVGAVLGLSRRRGRRPPREAPAPRNARTQA